MRKQRIKLMGTAQKNERFRFLLIEKCVSTEGSTKQSELQEESF